MKVTGPKGGRLGELPPEDRPREKLVARGAEALTDEDLVAILLGTGRAGTGVLETAREILRGNGLRGLLARSERGRVRDLALGIGMAKACRIAAAAELARRLARAETEERPLIDAPEVAGAYLAAALATELREVMGALLLDSKNRLLHDEIVFRGGVSSAAVQPGPLSGSPSSKGPRRSSSTTTTRPGTRRLPPKTAPRRPASWRPGTSSGFPFATTSSSGGALLLLPPRRADVGPSGTARGRSSRLIS